MMMTIDHIDKKKVEKLYRDNIVQRLNVFIPKLNFTVILVTTQLNLRFRKVMIYDVTNSIQQNTVLNDNEIFLRIQKLKIYTSKNILFN